MAFLDRIQACNRYDLAQFRPFVVANQRVGWVRRDIAAALCALPQVFAVTEAAVTLQPHLITAQQRTQAFHDAVRALPNLPPLRGEMYPVVTCWGQPPLMLMDRGLVVTFGVPSHGVHVNGLVQRPDGWHLWIGTRSQSKPVAPGKLDNMIAGGQPHNLSLMANLLKEAAEEADVPAALAATARPVGLITYVCEEPEGLRPDVMFCYDLLVPQDFIPRNTDGEIDHFTLMPVAQVAELVRDTDSFKPNVNLVIMDFLVRHGLLNADTEPDYIRIVRGLRREIITSSP